MTMRPRLRDLALTTHVLASVGWFGAVVVFLVVAVAGATTRDRQLASSAYVTMQLIGWWVIVPACFAALATGIVQSLGTKWGLFRYYWVLIKLVLTILATGFLMLHTRPIDDMAEMARTMTLAPDDHRGMRLQLVFDAGAALVVLIVNTVLAVYKPRGMTRYGRRKERGA
jgi:Predicted integral membrane protein (DUF2269)